MRNGFRRFFSLMTAGIMTVSLFTIGGTGSVTKAAEANIDAASAVNYSTVLGRAVDFGLTGAQITQTNHMETTIATKLYKNGEDGNGGNNNDIDLAGGDPVHLIIGGVYKEGDVESKVVLGKAAVVNPTMIYNVETTADIKNNILANKHSNCEATIKFSEAKAEDINKNIDNIIKHTQDDSKTMAAKTSLNLSTVGTYASPHYYLDLSDEQYEGKTVYIDVAQGSDIATAIANTGSFHVKKRSSTVIVFNVTANTNNGEGNRLDIVKFLVSVRKSDGTFTNEISSGDQDHSGNDTQHNRDIDNEICQKIIWNVINAKNVMIDNCAGAFLVPTTGSKISVGSSAGWLVTPGEIKNHAEWHFIYHGRSKDVNEGEGIGQMHFAARKAFTESFTTVKEDQTISMKEGDYKFNLYKTGSDYNTEGASLVGTAQNDGQSKIKFPTLSFETAGTHYYVIKEQNPGVVKNGIRNSDGEIDIQLVVEIDDAGTRTFKISSKQYLTSDDKKNSKASKTNDDVVMSGVEFSLGGFYNQIVKNIGTLKVTKAVSGAPKSASSKEYSFTVRGESSKKWVNADGSLSDTKVVHTIIDKETKTFEGLPFDTYKVAEENDDSIKIDNCTVDIANSTQEGSAVIDVSGETETVNLVNTYKQDKGELSITKKVETTSDSIIPPTTYQFAVKNEAGNYITDINGTEGTTTVSYLPGVAAGATLTISNLPVGKYFVEEKDARVEGTTLTVTTGLGEVEVTKDTTKAITLTNRYELPKVKSGEIHIQKNMAEGDTVPDGKTFPISVSFNKAGSYAVRVNGGETKMISFDANTAEIFDILYNGTIDIYDIPINTTYTVAENLSDEDKAAGFSTVGSPTNASKLIKDDEQSETVVVTNKYVKPVEKGNLIIKKSFSLGDGVTLTNEQKDKVTFTISKDGAEVKKVTMAQANPMGHISVEDLPVGNYTITESNNVIDGTTLSITTKVTVPGKTPFGGTAATFTAEVVSGTLNTGVEITNRYDKEEDNSEATSEDDSSTTSEQATTKEENVTSEQATTKQEDASSEQTTSTSEQATTSTEQATTTVEDVTTQTKVVTTKKTTESDDEDEDDDDDEDDGKGNLIITIYDEKTGNVVPGAKITLTKPNGNTKKYVTDNKGQVSIKNTPVGDYTVTVTEVPKGYTVTENAEVDVEVVKNKTTKAQVKIDKDGEVSVTSKVTKSAYKTGDSVPIIPIASAFIVAVLGLVILTVKRRQEV